MTKEELLADITSNHYVILKPSGTHGIGVFAVNTIPKGCRDMFSKTEGEWIKFTFEEISNLPENSRYLIENFCLYDDIHYFVPADGFKKMDISLYLNHSDTPNLTSINEGEAFEATRTILPGEELFLDYGSIVDWE